MFTPYVSACPSKGCPDPYIVEDYGYGSFISQEANHRILIWHMGEESGFLAFHGFHRESKVSIDLVPNL